MNIFKLLIIIFILTVTATSDLYAGIRVRSITKKIYSNAIEGRAHKYELEDVMRYMENKADKNAIISVYKPFHCFEQTGSYGTMKNCSNVTVETISALLDGNDPNDFNSNRIEYKYTDTNFSGTTLAPSKLKLEHKVNFYVNERRVNGDLSRLKNTSKGSSVDFKKQREQYRHYEKHVDDLIRKLKQSGKATEYSADPKSISTTNNNFHKTHNLQYQIRGYLFDKGVRYYVDIQKLANFDSKAEYEQLSIRTALKIDEK